MVYIILNAIFYPFDLLSFITMQ